VAPARMAQALCKFNSFAVGKKVLVEDLRAHRPKALRRCHTETPEGPKHSLDVSHGPLPISLCPRSTGRRATACQCQPSQSRLSILSTIPRSSGRVQMIRMEGVLWPLPGAGRRSSDMAFLHRIAIAFHRACGEVGARDQVSWNERRMALALAPLDLCLAP
jgi:hypothetical protein